MSEEVVKSVGRPRKALEYTHSALSTRKDPKTQHWELVELKYNALTDDVSPDIVVLQKHSDKSEIDFQFKVAAANLVNVGG